MFFLSGLMFEGGCVSRHIISHADSETKGRLGKVEDEREWDALK
jgi:hypothetical protein